MFCAFSTQKAWGLPAGFSVVSVSDKIFERSKKLKNKGYYFDFMNINNKSCLESIDIIFALQYISL